MGFIPISHLCLLTAPCMETSTGFLHSHHDYYYILCFGVGRHIYRGVFVIFFVLLRISLFPRTVCHSLLPCSLDTAQPQSHGCDPLPPLSNNFRKALLPIYIFLVPLCHFPFSSCKGKTPRPQRQLETRFLHFCVTSFSLLFLQWVKSPDSWKPNFSIAKVYRRNVTVRFWPVRNL